MDKEKRGGRGVTASPDALRTSGWRPTAIHPEFRVLVEAIAVSRNWSKAQVIERALLELAADEELLKALQVEQ